MEVSICHGVAVMIPMWVSLFMWKRAQLDGMGTAMTVISYRSLKCCARQARECNDFYYVMATTCVMWPNINYIDYYIYLLLFLSFV